MKTEGEKKVERNRRWQRRQIAAGLCAICGKVADEGFTRCGVCREKNRLYLKAYFKQYRRNRQR